MSRSQRVLRARLGGFSTSSRHDTRALTHPAREAFLARFEAEVDPGRELPEQERTRRALAARKLYFARLALKSAQARAKSKAAGARASMVEPGTAL
jgi:hypothetical protein